MEAKQREEKAMFEPNFNCDKPRLIKLDDTQARNLSETNDLRSSKHITSLVILQLTTAAYASALQGMET